MAQGSTEEAGLALDVSRAFSNGAHLDGDYFKMLVLHRSVVLQKKQEKEEVLPGLAKEKNLAK